MKILSLAINNFRQFKGEQVIDFSTSDEKKVTCIRGESGNGKTTLIHAFEWVFYGNVESDDGDRYPVNFDILSNLSNGEPTEVSGSVKFIFENKTYVAIRKQVFYKKGNNDAIRHNQSFCIYISNEDGTTSRIDDSNNQSQVLMNSIVPRALFQYFYLLGESLDDIGQKRSEGGKSGNDNFQSAIKGLLGLSERSEALKHLRKLVTQYNDEIAQNDKGTEIGENAEKRNFLNQKITSFNNEKQASINKVKGLDDEISELRTQISSNKNAGIKQEEDEKCLNRIDELERKITALERQFFKQFSEKSWGYFLSSLEDRTESVRESIKERKQGIPDRGAKAVEYRLDHKRCVCGRELIEGTDSWEHLQHRIEYLPPNSIAAESKEFNRYFSYCQNLGKECCEDLKNKWDQINNYKQELEALERKHGSLQEEIKDVQDVRGLKQQETDYILARDAEIKRQGQLEKEIEDSRKELEQCKVDAENLQSFDGKVQKLKLYRHYCEFMASSIDHDLKTREDNICNALTQNLNEIFGKYYHSTIQFNIDPQTYSVSIHDQSGESTFKDFTSGGQKTALALSFIGSIIKVNANRNAIAKPVPGQENVQDDDNTERYPLVLDAPTSTFDYEQIKSFAKVRPSITNQIIILVNAKETPQIKQNMGSMIGAQYHIEKCDDYTSNIIKENI